MDKTSKLEWLQHKTIAYYSGFGGIEIKDLEYDTDTYIIYVAGVWCSNKTVHRVKIYYTDIGIAYFKHKGIRIKLSECIKA